ncbi:protein trichome birefringence-like 26 [Iris pallida]|uniref:Protein trichome birefringence-like 26 n=1 Tax=Iris pallida TaxID=29817 RepID=A0AAX6GLE0_IRIPA|nr:protein trichome birefringence-like 26 [Iris pallida]
MAMDVGSDSDSDSSPLLSLPKKKENNRTIVKFAVAAIAVGVLAIFLFFSVVGNSKNGEGGQCNLFNGRWIPHPSGPSYNNGSCNFIDDADNCLKNGRPNTEYLYWRWKPYHCDLPPLDPEKFMNTMQDKSWALIGDSILRNQMMSMICLLSKVEEPVEVYHDEAYKSRSFYFPSHNLTIATIWAPFLVKSVTDEDDDGKAKNEIQLYVDVLEKEWEANYHKYDFVLISGGQWFTKTTVVWENNQVIGCHNCREKNLTELGLEYPYRKALELVFSFISKSDHKPVVIFRTWTPDHFEYGEWFSGGVCNRTEPYKEGQFNGRACDHMMRNIEIEEFRKAAAVGSKDGHDMELLDVYQLSLLRPDGHPGPYRRYHPFDKDKDAKVQNDCLHWCLPGPVDAWNDLMAKMLLD